MLVGTVLPAGLGLAQGHWLHARLYPRYLAIGFLEAFLAELLRCCGDGRARRGDSWEARLTRSRSRLSAGPLAAFVRFDSSGLVIWPKLPRRGLAFYWIHRLPALPRRFARPARPDDEILIVVAGESAPWAFLTTAGSLSERSSVANYKKRYLRITSGSRSWPKRGPRWRRMHRKARQFDRAARRTHRFLRT